MIQIVRMEVPCCSGMNYIVEQALQLAGKTGIIPVTHNIISIQGIIQNEIFFLQFYGVFHILVRVL